MAVRNDRAPGLLAFCRRYLDLVGLVGCFVIGAAVTALSYVAGIGQYGFGFAFIAGCALYLLYRSRLASSTGTPTDALGLRAVLGGTVVYLLALLGGIYLATAEPYVRPPGHFLLFTVAFATVLVDVLAVERERLAVFTGLTKILLASIAFRSIRFFSYPVFPGNDVYFHTILARRIAQTGRIPSPETVSFPKYAVTSLWHATVAAVQLVFGLDATSAVFAGIVVPFAVLTVLAAFAIVLRHTGQSQPALLAALFVSVGDMFLVRGLTSITPSSLVVGFTFVLLLLLLVQLERLQHVAVFVVLIATFLTHQLSAFGMVAVLGSFFLGTRLYRVLAGSVSRRSLESTLLPRRPPVTFAHLLFAGVTMVFVWMHVPSGPEAGNFFTGAIERAVDAGAELLGLTGASEEGDAAYVGAFATYSFLSNLLYSLGYSLLMLFGVVGALVWLREDHQSPSRLAYVVVALVLLTMIYPMTYLGLDLLFIPHRLIVFLEIFLAILGGVAAWKLYVSTDFRGAHVATGALVVSLVFFSITAPYVNRNDPMYDDERVSRTELTQAELDGMLWASVNGEFVYADPRMSNRVLGFMAREAGIANPTPMRAYPNVSAPNASFANPPGPAAATPNGSAVVILREYTTRQTLVYGGTYGSGQKRLDGSDVRNKTLLLSRVYANGETANYYVETEG